MRLIVMDKPIGVAGYQLTKDVPERLKDALPDVAQLEEKIQFELGATETSAGKNETNKG
jgi:hypothetical protein